MTQRSIYNNTNIPLKPFGIFTGQWEPTSTYLEISTYVNSSAYLAVGIQQSQDASAVVINTTYNYTPTEDVTVFNVGVGLPFYRVVITNEANVQVAHMAITTILSAVPNTVDANITGTVIVSGTVAVSSIAGVVDISGNVVSTPAMLSAQLRNTPLVVGHWYQVASVGDTPGAVWAEMGAIVGSESVPPVGRQFQCLYAGYGTGTAYDITAPVDSIGVAVVDVSGNTYDVSSNLLVNVANLPLNTSSNTVRCSVDNWTTGVSIPVVIDTDGNTIKIDQTSSATNGVSIVSPLDVSGNVLTSAPLTTYPYASATYPVAPQGLAGCKIMGMNGGSETWLVDGGYLPVSITEANGNTIKIDQTSPTTNGVSFNDSSTVTVTNITGPLPVGTNILGFVGLDATNGNNTVAISQNGIDNGVQVLTALPAGANVIGKVGLDTGGNTIGAVGIDAALNTIKIDPAYNAVSGSVSITNSFNLNTFTYASVSDAWVSDSADLRVYSLADIYMLSAGSVTSTLGMNFIVQYSPDNIHWFDSGNSLTLTSSVPQGIAIGTLTASPFIRLIADPANTSGDVATDVSLWIPTKAI